MDIRENAPNLEEIVRACFAGLMRDVWTAMPAHVVEDSKDGHVVSMQPTIKRREIDPETGDVTFQDHPIHPDSPISHTGGGGVSHTFPTKTGDTGALLYMARSIDSWFQSDGTQIPIDHRTHSLADAVFISGIRSVPRMLQQVEPDATQIRSDDKRHVISHHPETGTHIKSADPSTPPASLSFDPFKQATKYLEHLVQGGSGLFHRAVDGSTTHTHGVTHADGAFMLAANALHSVLAHPSNGASLNAENLLHQVMAHPSLGALLSAQSGEHIVQAHPQNGVVISSATKIALSAPSVTVPDGSFGGASLSAGAAAENIGDLGGDLSGDLPNPKVVGFSHVRGLNLLPNFANDTAAAAGGVVVGAPYRNGSALMTRVA